MYYPRLIEEKIKTALITSGVVVIAGPKFCGKTTTSKVFSKSEYVLDTKAKIEMTSADPNTILEIGDSPRLIDEWQNVPDLWNCARTIVDARENKFGQFIFTGSSTPADMSEIYHSGAGRIVTLSMRPMSLYESKESKNKVSIRELFDTNKRMVFLNDNYSLLDTAFYIVRGGWPLSVFAKKDVAIQVTRNYVSTLFNFENSKNEKFRNKKKKIFNMLLKSYARNISTEARKSVLIQDISLHEDRKLDELTFDSYKEALEDLYIIKDIDAWNPNLRSKTAIISTPTRHFVDTSIAAAALNISPNDLINDPNTFGLFFEDFAVKELSVYMDCLGGEIKHFRDSNGLECDAVLHLDDGRYALVEIKLGGENFIEEGVSNLKSLSKKIVNSGHPEPSFKMIVTASGDCRTNEDGVHIVPINMLMP